MVAMWLLWFSMWYSILYIIPILVYVQPKHGHNENDLASSLWLYYCVRGSYCVRASAAQILKLVSVLPQNAHNKNLKKLHEFSHRSSNPFLICK